MGWEPLSTTHSEPKPLQVGLDRVVRLLGLPEADAVTLLFVRWEEVVGADLASNCKPVRLRGKQLVIEAVDNVWAAELRWMESDLLQRCTDAVGTDAISSVRVVVARP